MRAFFLLFTLHRLKPSKQNRQNTMIYNYLYNVKTIPSYLKNKYILTTIGILFYTLFLDENDIFFILRQRNKLSEINQKKMETNEQLERTNSVLLKLESIEEVAKFAREEKQFKKDNEDIFVIFNEKK